MPFNAPSDAIARVLRKIGVDPAERITEFCQDPEYTACRAEEVPAYFELYRGGEVDGAERAVLCCFLLEGLNDFCGQREPHDLQPHIFNALFAAGDVHAEELAYWMNTSDPDPDNWWPITAHLLKHHEARHHKGGA